MCIVPSNRPAFVDWLRGRPDPVPHRDEKGNLRRLVAGHFLKDVFSGARTVAATSGGTEAGQGLDVQPDEPYP